VHASLKSPRKDEEDMHKLQKPLADLKEGGDLQAFGQAVKRTHTIATGALKPPCHVDYRDSCELALPQAIANWQGVTSAAYAFSVCRVL